MSKLISLTIKGIRLFNPEPKEEYKQTINFDNNIILITGPNGSGKTTIFESLQYALTGLCRKKYWILLRYQCSWQERLHG